MNFSASSIAIALITGLGLLTTHAQTLAPSPAKSSSQAEQLQALAKKIDEQNAKIDILSQQILKLQQQLGTTTANTTTTGRPGVMIGEATPSATNATVASETPRPGNGNSSHIVARGETLTSIAKQHNTTVSELQRYNHIDNPLKLQAGQTILIPTSPAPGASPSSSGE
jgi:LysM repeat protein